jgi:hypothetical protein
VIAIDEWYLPSCWDATIELRSQYLLFAFTLAHANTVYKVMWLTNQEEEIDQDHTHNFRVGLDAS